jgi:hypothetical protein
MIISPKKMAGSFLFVLAVVSSLQFSSNPPIDRTGRSGTNCTGCHSGSLNPTGGSLSLSGITHYYPGGSYTLDITQTGGTRYGFEVTSVRASSINTAAGSFSSGTNISVRSSGGRSYAAHNPKQASGSWSVSWTAPSTNVGSVTFYAAGVSANNNGGTSGDKTYTQTLTVTALPTISYTVSSIAPTCFGDTNGTAVVSTPSGGAGGPYTYAWSGGITSTSNQATGLASGSYTVTVTDGQGNDESKSFNVANGARPNLSFNSNPTICGDSTGTTTLTTTGGFPPYSVLWNTGDTFSILSGLKAGVYTVTVTDDSSCVRTSSVQILNSGTNIQAFLSDGEDYCSSGNGYLLLDSLSGVQGSPSFIWSNGSLDDSATGLAAGNYFLTVTDSIGCQEVFSDTVHSATSLSAILIGTGDDACQAGIGFMKVNGTTGDIGGVNYSWSNGTTGMDSIGGLTAGSFSVTVTDGVGCSVAESRMIQDSQSPTSNLVVSNVQCNGDSSGTIVAKVAEGTPPYSYSWSNGSVTDSVYDLTAGEYIVTITDSLGCVKLDTALLSDPPSIEVDSISAVATDTALCDGSLEVFAQGGTGNLSYQWDDPAQSTTAAITSLCPGLYQVTVTDDNLCELVRQEAVNELPSGLVERSFPWTMEQSGNILRFSGKPSTSFALSLYDLSGKRLFSNAYVKDGVVVSMEGIASGVYMLQFEYEGQIQFHKVYNP